MRPTLQQCIERSRIEYAKRGHDENSWQWRDEGIVYAIQDYLSSYEMTEKDWEYAVYSGIDDLVIQLQEDDK